MTDDLKQALIKETEARLYLEQLKQKIAYTTGQAGPVPGVSAISNTPACCAVRFNALQTSVNLAPTTYLPAAQQQAVTRRLAACNTVSALLAALEDMVTTKRIRFSDGSSVTLNNNTITELRSFLDAT